jgi:hypothetical protein
MQAEQMPHHMRNQHFYIGIARLSRLTAGHLCWERWHFFPAAPAVCATAAAPHQRGFGPPCAHALLLQLSPQLLHSLALLPLLSIEHYINKDGVTSLPQVAADAASKHVAQHVSILLD